MRLFIAIDLDYQLKSEALLTLNEFKKITESGLFTEKENFHITLAFLGEMDSSSIQTLAQLIQTINYHEFSTRFTTIDTFERHGTITYYMGLEPTGEINELRTQLVNKLIEQNYYFDNTPFIAHATLGILVKLKEKHNVSKILSYLPPSEIKINTISLMESKKIDGKLMYLTHFVHHFK